MEKNIEVEIRGKIAEEKVKEVLDFLGRNGEKKPEKNRVFLDYSTFLPEQGIEKRTKDIRLRATNGVPEIIVKLGNWGGSENRKEISVPTSQGSFDKLVQVFGAIGLEKAILCIRKSYVFQYENVELAIVEVPNHSFYFEAEKMLSPNEDKTKAEKAIRDICKKLRLEPFSDQEFFAYVEKLNQEANEVFDFKNYQEGYFKKRFGL